MANRNTKTEKWTDDWFCDLKPNEKLMFLFLVENCDIGGFFELNVKLMSYMIGFTRAEVEAAILGINKSFIKSDDGKCIWIKNYIKHQNNFPLHFGNKAHEGAMTRIINKLPSFSFNDELLQILPKTLSVGIAGEMGGTRKMNSEYMKGLGTGLGRALKGLQSTFEVSLNNKGAIKGSESPSGNSNSSSNSKLNIDNNNLITSEHIAEIDLEKNQISANEKKIDSENEPIEVMAEEIHVSENGEKKSKKTGAKKSKKEKAESLHAKMKKSWCDFYKIKKGMEYYWQPKDAVNLNQITAKIKFHLKPAFESNGTDEEIPDEVTDNAFKAVLLSINDKFLMDNLEVAMLNSKLQPLLAKLKDRFGENSSRDSAIDQFVNG